MFKNILKMGLAVTSAALAGFIVLGLLFMIAFIKLWWDFPGSWQALNGLDAPPGELFAYAVPEEVFRVRTESGQAFTCQNKTCLPDRENGRTDEQFCDASTRPAVALTFPWLLSWDIRTALACEKSYMDTGLTVFIVTDRQGRSYTESGASLLPTDAAVIGVGLLGGVIGFVAVLAVAAVSGVIHTLNGRKKGKIPADVSPDPDRPG